MATMEDVEGYLIRMDQPFEELDDGLWVIHDEYDHIDNIVISYADPLVLFRVKLMELPAGDNTELFRLLLEYNTTDLLHGAYGLEGNNIVVTDTREAVNMDFNEFQASVDSLALAIAEHYPKLSAFRTAAS
jgi:hypothetical protein